MVRRDLKPDTHSSSKIAIIRCARGLFAICGIWRNSSLSMEPEPSLSSFMNRFFSRRSSGAETEREEEEVKEVCSSGVEGYDERVSDSC